MCVCVKTKTQICVFVFTAQARCFEEENEFLEGEILELEDSGPPAGGPGSRLAVADYSLDAVVDRLRRERVRLWEGLEGWRVVVCASLSSANIDTGSTQRPESLYCLQYDKTRDS